MSNVLSFRRRLLKSAIKKDEIRAICFSTLNDNEQQTIKCKLKTGISLEYSINGKTFQNYVSETPIDFGGDTKVYFRGNNNISFGDYDNTKSTNFILLNDNVKTKCEGNIMFLINYDNIENDIKNYNQFADLFRNCYSLISAPELPATILSTSCYANMFYHCTNLIFAPELPAIKLTQKCYEGMFNGCTSLVNAPELPATILANWCYNSMFKGCVSLTNAPELLSENVPYYAYNGMFQNCTNLNYIKCLAKSFSNDSMLNWVNGVQTEYGTFIKKDGVQWNRGVNGIPTNWVVQNISGTTLNINLTKDIINEKYGSQLNIESDINWEIFSYPNWVQLDKLSGSGNDVVNVQYVDDQQGKIKAGTILVKNLTTNTTEQVNLYGLNTIKQELTFIISSGGILRWKFDDKGEPNPKTIEYTKDGGTTWTSITSSNDTSLNGISVSKGDIISFRGNNATYAQDNNIGSQFGTNSNVKYICGNIMSLIDSTNFENLTQLTQSFALHALFKQFTNLTDASNLSLPATTLTQSCYRGMFESCTKLLYAPELLASQLVQDCYRYMFNACSSLIYIKCLCDTNIQADTYTQNWVQNAKNTNECKFVKKSTTQIYKDNNSGIPRNWVIEDI